MKTKKRGNIRLWILIILISVAVGIGIYFWLSGGSGGILQPPALPS